MNHPVYARKIRLISNSRAPTFSHCKKRKANCKEKKNFKTNWVKRSSGWWCVLRASSCGLETNLFRRPGLVVLISFQSLDVRACSPFWLWSHFESICSIICKNQSRHSIPVILRGNRQFAPRSDAVIGRSSLNHVVSSSFGCAARQWFAGRLDRLQSRLGGVSRGFVVGGV